MMALLPPRTRRIASRVPGRALAALVALLLAAAMTGCGSGGSAVPSSSGSSGTTVEIGNLTPDVGPGPDPAGVASTLVTLSGTVTFENYAPTISAGLDYDDPQSLPARGIPVVIYRAYDGVEIGRTETAADGSFSVSNVPTGIHVEVNAYAGLGSVSNPRVAVRDPTDSEAWWVVWATIPVEDGTTDLSVDIPGGWTGSGYDQTLRLSGPYAIADAIYKAESLVGPVADLSALPRLDVWWSPDSTMGSWYARGFHVMSIYAIEGVDTDEFDSGVVIHEWGHYYEDVFSRGDSLGGSHSLRDHLDPTVAWGEGFATGLTGIVFDSVGEPPRYLDTATLLDESGNVVDPNGTALDIDIETGLVNGVPLDSNDGYWSELSVLQVVYDLYDTADDGEAIALSFGQIHDVMNIHQSDTPAFTNLYSFLLGVKAVYGGPTGDIDNLALRESVANSVEPMGEDLASSSATDQDAISIELSDGITVSTDPTGADLQTYATYDAGSWDGNKFRQRWFFRYTAPAAGSLVIEITPEGSDGSGTSGNISVTRPGSRASVASGSNATVIYAPAPLSGGEVFYFSVATPSAPTHFSVTPTFTMSKVAN